MQQLEHAGRYYSSRKQYPALISGGTLPAGHVVEGMIAEMPLYKYDEDFTGVCWYWLHDDIILMIDAHKSVDKALFLPEYMNGRAIQVLDKTDSCEICQQVIENQQLHLHIEDYGYLVVRLSI